MGFRDSAQHRIPDNPLGPCQVPSRCAIDQQSRYQKVFDSCGYFQACKGGAILSLDLQPAWLDWGKMKVVAGNPHVSI